MIEQLATDGQVTLRTYHVEYENGAGAICTEADLEPVTASRTLHPSARLAERDLDHLLSFRRREALRGAQLQNLSQGGHLMALLSARIDLHPHQAFGADTVLDDRRRRYILADEVGFHKTIEAGVIIHDLLSGNPAARVLIICPGTLTQQWFCEIYSKFGGQVFTLLDLHPDASLKLHALSHVIASMTQVTRCAGVELAKIDWDLVVVDECHHLLSAPTLYNFVRDLARRTPEILLLSAIPAQQKEDEFLRLFALLEPDRFSAEQPESVEQFKTLYNNQAQLSRRLQPLVIRLRGMQSGEYTPEDVSRQTRRLLELPCWRKTKHSPGLPRTSTAPRSRSRAPLRRSLTMSRTATGSTGESSATAARSSSATAGSNPCSVSRNASHTLWARGKPMPWQPLTTFSSRPGVMAKTRC